MAERTSPLSTSARALSQTVRHSSLSLTASALVRCRCSGESDALIDRGSPATQSLAAHTCLNCWWTACRWA